MARHAQIIVKCIFLSGLYLYEYSSPLKHVQGLHASGQHWGFEADTRTSSTSVLRPPVGPRGPSGGSPRADYRQTHFKVAYRCTVEKLIGARVRPKRQWGALGV